MNKLLSIYLIVGLRTCVVYVGAVCGRIDGKGDFKFGWGLVRHLPQFYLSVLLI